MGWLAGIGVEAAKGVVWHDHLELRSENLVLFHCCGRANAQKQAARAIDVHPVNTSQQSMILHEEHAPFVCLSFYATPPGLLVLPDKHLTASGR